MKTSSPPSMPLLQAILIVLLWCSCRERYDANFINPDTGFLVVEGFINNGNTPTVIRLSRTIKLTDATAEEMEEGATVFIESDDNARFPLRETGPGIYTGDPINLTAGKKYRLLIQAKGKEYISAYSSIRTTPAIDSISWQRESQGVRLYVHTQDPSGEARHFQWKYEDTWETNAPFSSELRYVYDNAGKVESVWFHPNGQADAPPRRCWQQAISRSLLIGTTEHLDQSVVFLPLYAISNGSPKLSVMYSTLVKQYSISKAAYNFLLRMKKNSEQLGSIFDAQPSELIGNIRCSSDPSEPVIGFVEVTQEQTKRIFLTAADVGGWQYVFPGCEPVIVDNIGDSILKNSINMGLVPGAPYQSVPEPPPIKIITFTAYRPACVDCTLSGGSTLKPVFWP